MPLIFPAPFPNENRPDKLEVFRFGRANWEQAQKFRCGQFAYADTIPAATVRTVTFTDVSAGGTDTGVDNLKAGMWVNVTPPASIPPGLQVDYGYSPAPATLVIQLRNETAAPISVSGTWSYAGFTF
jgi:hypothetical protein